MHTSPSLFSRKFIPPFSLLLIGLIALLVKCWDLLLQRFETAPCNVYLPDMAEIICLHHTWSASAFWGWQGLLGLGFGPEGWIGHLPKLGGQGGQHQRARREWVSNTCWNIHIYSGNTHRIMELLRLGKIFEVITSKNQPSTTPMFTSTPVWKMPESFRLENFLNHQIQPFPPHWTIS